jgi:predicted secreted protein
MESSSEYRVEGKAGEPIPLPISSGPATGYAWKLEAPSGVERIENEAGRTVDASIRPGSSAGGRLQVRAERGDHVIVARLVRSWDPGHPANVVTIHLHVE